MGKLLEMRQKEAMPVANKLHWIDYRLWSVWYVSLPGRATLEIFSNFSIKILKLRDKIHLHEVYNDMYKIGKHKANRRVVATRDPLQVEWQSHLYIRTYPAVTANNRSFYAAFVSHLGTFPKHTVWPNLEHQATQWVHQILFQINKK